MLGGGLPSHLFLKFCSKYLHKTPSESSALEIKMQRMNNTVNFSCPYPSDHEKMTEIDQNSTHEQCSATWENILIQY
jgi:hypothetical protein